MNSTNPSQPARLPVGLSWREIDDVLSVPEAEDARPIRTCVHCGWHGVIVRTPIGTNRDGSVRWRCFDEESCIDRWFGALHGRPYYGLLVTPNETLPLPLPGIGAA